VRHSTKRRLTRWVLAAVFAGVVAGITWRYWPPDAGRPRDANTADANTLAGDANAPAGDANAPATRRARDANTPPGGDGPATREIAVSNGVIRALRKLSAAAAQEAVGKGNELLAAGKLAEGRAELSRAVLSGSLPPAAAETARKKLTDLADRMTFSRRIYDGDPYVMQYAFRKGDVLAKVERKLRLHVPTQILLKINNMTHPTRIRVGQTFKMIRGPFHAVVSKGRFTMDLYLHREGCLPVFIRRLGVGLGKNGSTPNGLWHIKLGSKHDRANWNPPPNSPIQRSIRWGEPGYPLGKRGYWIGLEGIEEKTRLHMGYGIHGTNDPTSIGRAVSLGCIRLADADIERVFSLLYEHWSTVRVES